MAVRQATCSVPDRHSSIAADSMPPTPHPQQTYRGPENALHNASRRGASELVTALLSSGAVDVNQCDLGGMGPLMLAAEKGSSSVVKDPPKIRSQRINQGEWRLHSSPLSSQHRQATVTRLPLRRPAHPSKRSTTPLYIASLGSATRAMEGDGSSDRGRSERQ